jgi:hypothetical protein
MSDKVSLLMNSLNEFYRDGEYISKIKPILEQKAEVSLRILDWFITNYSKKYRIIINDTFDVYQNYKLMLRSFSKRQFDPFCRKNKILFYYKNIEGNCEKSAETCENEESTLNERDQTDDKSCLETSCGQLCFFRWCFQNGIIEYVEKNLKDIEEDMKVSLKNGKDPKDPKDQKDRELKERKRQQLSVSAARSISKRNIKYTITFD